MGKHYDTADVLCNISEALISYQPLIGPLASCFTVFQFLAGSCICREISFKRNTKGISSWPFIGGLIMGMLMSYYSIMIEDFTLFVVNFTAIFFNSIYTYIYNKYSRSKTRDVKEPLKWGLILTSFLIVYSMWENDKVLGYRYGLIVTTLMLLLIGSPLLEMTKIINSRDVSSIPIQLTATSFVACFLWFLYGITIKNQFLVVQNFIGFCICGLQILLYLKYRGCESSERSSRST